MFSDRFLVTRLFLVCLTLWGSCVYCRNRGEERYPSQAMCQANPERFADATLYLRSYRVLDVSPGRVRLEGKWKERIEVQGTLPPDWAGQRATLVCRFRAPGGGIPPYLDLEHRADATPLARLEAEYVDRRILMYVVSSGILVLLGILFRREFTLSVPRNLIVERNP